MFLIISVTLSPRILQDFAQIAKGSGANLIPKNDTSVPCQYLNYTVLLFATWVYKILQFKCTLTHTVGTPVNVTGTPAKAVVSFPCGKRRAVDSDVPRTVH